MTKTRNRIASDARHENRTVLPVPVTDEARLVV